MYRPDASDDDLTALAVARRLARTGDGRRLREAAGLTVPEVARAARVGDGSIRTWEAGGRPSLRYGAVRWVETLSEVARFLDVVDPAAIPEWLRDVSTRVDEGTSAGYETRRILDGNARIAAAVEPEKASTP